MAEDDLDDPTDYGSIVRNNLMKRPGYAPYCMAQKPVDDGYVGTGCSMPRMKWDGEQFACRCGCRTEFPKDFIAGYKARWHRPTPRHRRPRAMTSERVEEIVDRDQEAKIDAMRLKCFRTNDRNDKESLLHMLMKWFGERHERRMDAE